MRRAALALGFVAGLTGSALATGTISCVSEEGVTLDMGVGSLQILAVLSAHIQHGGEMLSTDDGTIGAVQAFRDEEKILIDFTDEIVNEIVARLRLFHVAEGRDYAIAGTLQIVGAGAYAVTCTGP